MMASFVKLLLEQAERQAMICEQSKNDEAVVRSKLEDSEMGQVINEAAN